MSEEITEKDIEELNAYLEKNRKCRTSNSKPALDSFDYGYIEEILTRLNEFALDENFYVSNHDLAEEIDDNVHSVKIYLERIETVYSQITSQNDDLSEYWKEVEKNIDYNLPESMPENIQNSKTPITIYTPVFTSKTLRNKILEEFQ